MPTVLVIDDDQAIQLLVRDVLRDAGYDVLTSGTAEDALHALEDTHPDLVVLDLSLPHGEEALIQRVVRASQDARLLVLSGSVELRERARELGAHANLGKPFDLDEFVTMVDRLTASTRPWDRVGPAA